MITLYPTMMVQPLTLGPLAQPTMVAVPDLTVTAINSVKADSSVVTVCPKSTSAFEGTSHRTNGRLHAPLWASVSSLLGASACYKTDWNSLLAFGVLTGVVFLFMSPFIFSQIAADKIKDSFSATMQKALTAIHEKRTVLLLLGAAREIKAGNEFDRLVKVDIFSSNVLLNIQLILSTQTKLTLEEALEILSACKPDVALVVSQLIKNRFPH